MTTAISKTPATIVVALTLLAVHTGPASAQLPQASAAALGLGNNVTASARGFAAIANNPAGLGHPGSPGFSMAIPAVAFDLGMDPVTLGDLADWENELIPDATKAEWLARIRESGRQVGNLDLNATGLALSVGHVGLQISSIAVGLTDLAPDGAEALLFGNAGRTGAPADLALLGSAVDGFWLSTAALSFGFEATPSLYLGVTGKYTMGHGLVVGRDFGSAFSSDPLQVELEFPVLLPRTEDPSYNEGTGFGLDLGALWVGPEVTVGASLQNVFHTLEWDLDDMSYVPGLALFDHDTTSSDFDEQPASAAPQPLLDVVATRTIEPVLSVGAEWRPDIWWRFQADVRKRFGDGLELGPEFHAGVGAEFSAISFLPLRAHVAAVTGGIQLGGGASLVLGPVHLSGAGAYRTGDANSVIGMFTLSFGAS